MAIQQLPTEGGEPETTGQPLAVDFAAQDTHMDQPEQMVLENLGVARPVLVTAMAVTLQP